MQHAICHHLCRPSVFVPLLPATLASPPTLFCGQDCCFSYHKEPATWPMARQACLRAGGELFKPDTFERQLEVEAYFSSTESLNSTSYWIGVSRNNYTSQYRCGQAGVAAGMLCLADHRCTCVQPADICTD